MSPEVKELLKRTAYAAIGEALPSDSGFSSALRHLRGAVAGIVVTAIAFSALVVTGCFGLYLWRVETGDAPLDALAWSASALAIFTVASAVFVKYSLSRAKRVKNSLKIFPRMRRTKQKAASVVEPAIASFIEGLTGEYKTQQASTQARPERKPYDYASSGAAKSNLRSENVEETSPLH